MNHENGASPGTSAIAHCVNPDGAPVSEITAPATGVPPPWPPGPASPRWVPASFAVVGLVYLVSAQTARGQRIENALFDARRRAARPRTTALEILATISVWSLGAAIAAVVAVALVRGRPRLALGAGVIGVSILTTEVLKELVLPRPQLDPPRRPGTWTTCSRAGTRPS